MEQSKQLEYRWGQAGRHAAASAALAGERALSRVAGAASLPRRAGRRAPSGAPQIIESMSEARISLTICCGRASRSLNTLSITLSSVEVVSSPQKAAQSLATMPATGRGWGRVRG